MSKPVRSRRQIRLFERYGPWAVVTGASSGIGEAFARRLSAAGFKVVLAARREAVLERLAGALRTADGVETRVVAADLSGAEGHRALVEATGDLDVGLLVCSAGFGASGAFIDAKVDDEIAMVDLNCRALMMQAWHYGRRFAAQRRGGLVLMSSLVAFQGVARAAHYSATKAYVQSLAEGLHHELAVHGVDVLASAPGPIHSGFAARAGMTMGMAQKPEDVAEASLDALGHTMTVRPGWLSKALELSLKTLPRWGRVRMMSVVMKGMAAKAKA